MTRRGPGAGRWPALARLILLFACLTLARPALALDPSPAFRQRADQLVELLSGKGEPDAIFAPPLLAEVPSEQVRTIARELSGQFGAAGRIERIEMRGSTSGTITVAFERASVRVDMVVDPQPPNRIKAFFLAGADVKGDSLAGIAREMWALPGEASIAVARLDGAQPSFSIAHKADQPMAIGSTYKLFVLAELCRSISAGERKWTDVVRLDRKSIPTGILQEWPVGSPMTLHSLAALMISQSDNSAADMLLHLLGREKVEALLPAIGVRTPERLRPLLSTREAALIKAGEDAMLAARWAAAGETERRAILADLAAVPPGAIDIGKLAGAPVAIQTVEWFASTGDLVRVLNWLRINGGSEALAMLAINPGLPRQASDFAFLGYKGGSESGVMNMTFLIRAKDGGWKAASLTWNDPAEGLEETRLVLFASRVAALLR